MLKPIKDLFLKSSPYLAVLVTISIGVLSLIKMPSEGISVSVSDKFLHVIAYFTLMICWLFALSKNEQFAVRMKYAILGCLIYGIVLEVLQSALTSYRTASYLDILANSVGIALAVLAFQLIGKKIRTN